MAARWLTIKARLTHFRDFRRRNFPEEQRKHTAGTSHRNSKPSKPALEGWGRLSNFNAPAGSGVLFRDPLAGTTGGFSSSLRAAARIPQGSTL